MAIQSLLIVNKSGGLIYHRNFTGTGSHEQQKQPLNSNDYLILASTLHGVFAIASQLTPKALQLSQTQIDYTIPYIPNLGTSSGAANATSSGGRGSNIGKLGSFKGDDFFKDSFTSWNKSGLRQLCTDQFTMFIYQTMSGLKFIAISSTVMPQRQDLNPDRNKNINPNNLAIQVADNFLRKVYCLYSDYVMKDPFYSMEMPIKSDLFEKKVNAMIDNIS
ncbi:TRAPP subunit TRS23 NDAI_0C05150 [Naumovozyma dairenensis CBS 421]|uniref:Trafficking protein particle complex subunit n=1 Tax=Naumovozyma dairenensis (strain ATCC 10597 / BCRC 20456 / CBS 421 / NBRC 0211 / NRRL Y-12639) TaxID=1071378 RepID=G0W8R3_NAUDC|nr:hypothetical protein NDAI_0C05150 [Naumovozyma dairenensis CBS 421]CCD24174.1 hypothetical protein NDAI_0C05150 [Naumovozyma dairenensis CBS 421]